jgi:outer membrane protein assembly factor BamB/orotate phosphoribosyltransferase
MNEKQKLKHLIIEKVFIKNSIEQIGRHNDQNAWIFDFRKLLMNGMAANLISDIFYEKYQASYPFQLCALEIAGVPLATSIMTKFYYKGHHDINAFFIRKSRKKTGLHRMIEGQILEEKKIILVDDSLNSGGSFWRQVLILESLGYRVDTVWSILRFRDEAFYKRFHLRGIKVESLFELNEFTEFLGPNVRNLVQKTHKPLPMPFSPLWTFKSPHPSLGWVVCKSQPILDESKLYFGSDNQTFWALNQSDGSVAWKYVTGSVLKKKSIFSNPILYKDTVIFGSYDGNVYCLDKHTGAVRWISFEADWVGSSPAIAEDLGIVFIGLEFGLLYKRGGIIALDATTGTPLWIDRGHTAMTHCSPHYIKAHKQVVIGSNDGIARLYDARSGEKLWEFTTFGSADYIPEVGRIGYSKGDIKEGFTYVEKQDYIIFGAVDGFLYILERKTGHLVHHYKCEFGIFSIPCVYNNHVYFTATDKRIRSIHLDTFALVFDVNVDQTRMFSSPVVINDRLYIGTNAGKLHEINPHTGERLGYFQTLERITNSPVYNPATNTFFLPTYANEIIALKREPYLDVAEGENNGLNI